MKKSLAEMVEIEIDSIIYDLFDKVSYRMWGNRKCKDEIRTIQQRLAALKTAIGNGVSPSNGESVK